MKTPDYNPRILVVDDNANIRRLINAILKNRYTIIEAEGGEEALRILNDQAPPDLILLDIMMPGVDGYQVFEVVRKTPRISDIPVIFVTALDGKVAELKGFETGAVDYITKPFEKDILLVRIESALELHRYLRNPLDDIPELPSEFFEPDEFEPKPELQEQDDKAPAVICAIDGNEQTRKQIEEELGNDCRVSSYETAEQVIEEMNSNFVPDLILLDVSTQEAGGFEVVGKLKNRETTSAIPIICLTASNNTGDEIRAFQSGAVDFVRKPIDTAILKARIRNQLNLDRKRKQFEADMEAFEED